MTDAKRKAVERFLSQQVLTSEGLVIKKFDGLYIRSRLPEVLTRKDTAFILNLADHLDCKKISAGQARAQIKSMFQMTKQNGKSGVNLFFEDLERISTLRNELRLLAPMFFTEFSNPEVIHELMDYEEANSQNEILATAIWRGYAKLRPTDGGGVRDFASFLAYGNLPGQKRDKAVTVDRKLRKQMDDCARECHAAYSELITNHEISFGLRLPTDIDERIRRHLRR